MIFNQRPENATMSQDTCQRCPETSRAPRAAFEPSTGGMEKSCNSATFRCQPVVCRQRGISLLAQDRDATCFKQGKCLGRDTQAALAAAAEDHQIRLVVQQLCHVSAENAWSVICTGFAPIPRSPAAGLKFGVAEPAEPLYFDEAPTVFDHLGRRLAHRFEASAPVSGQRRLDTPTAVVGLRPLSAVQVGHA
jgi:hypothetical protein